MALFSRDKPKIKVQTSKSDSFSGWLKCSHCEELIHTNELNSNNNCCPKCDYHYRLSADARIKLLADEDSFEVMFNDLEPCDPLSFTDTESYADRLNDAKDKTAQNEAVIVGTCLIEGRRVAMGVMDFAFMGGSMGSVVGERLTLIIEHATEKKLPLVIVSTSGGARMQESVLSLMQMAKTSAALAKHSEAHLPYISVLTNPTSGGVTASFASLGDVILAEPKALICFAGPRVIEQTIGQKLPEDAQKSEFLLKHGMIDGIVKRHELKKKVIEACEFLTGNERRFDSAATVEAAPKKRRVRRRKPAIV